VVFACLMAGVNLKLNLNLFVCVRAGKSASAKSNGSEGGCATQSAFEAAAGAMWCDWAF